MRITPVLLPHVAATARSSDYGQIAAPTKPLSFAVRRSKLDAKASGYNEAGG
jgi:hypothetical protein